MHPAMIDQLVQFGLRPHDGRHVDTLHAMHLTVISNMPSGLPRSVESVHVKVNPVIFTDSAENYTADTTKVTGLKLPSTDSRGVQVA